MNITQPNKCVFVNIRFLDKYITNDIWDRFKALVTGHSLFFSLHQVHGFFAFLFIIFGIFFSF